MTDGGGQTTEQVSREKDSHPPSLCGPPAPTSQGVGAGGYSSSCGVKDEDVDTSN